MKKSLKEKPLIFLDIETTGLDPMHHEIIEIATRSVGGFRHRSHNLWSTRIQPKHIERAHPKALEINGYNEVDWKGAPTIEEVVPLIREHLRGGVLCGHNVKFDIGFIKQAYKDHSDRGMGFHHTIDTVTLAYEHLAPLGLDSLSLHNVCTFLGISNDGEHTAAADVDRCYKVYRKLTRAGTLDRLRWRWNNAMRGKLKRG